MSSHPVENHRLSMPCTCKFLACAAFVSLLVAAANGQEKRKKDDTFFADVLAVSDGDSLRVEDEAGREERVRIYAADCPEPGRAWWKEARKFTEQAVKGKKLKYTVKRRDGKYLVCEVTLADGASLGEKLVEAGWATHRAADTKKAKDEETAKRFTALEEDARRKKVGMWQDEAPKKPQ